MEYRHREVLDHIQQRDYRDVELYDEWNDKWELRMNTVMWVVLFLFSGYMLYHVVLWSWKQ